MDIFTDIFDIDNIEQLYLFNFNSELIYCLYKPLYKLK